MHYRRFLLSFGDNVFNNPQSKQKVIQHVKDYLSRYEELFQREKKANRISENARLYVER